MHRVSCILTSSRPSSFKRAWFFSIWASLWVSKSFILFVRRSKPEESSGTHLDCRRPPTMICNYCEIYSGTVSASWTRGTVKWYLGLDRTFAIEAIQMNAPVLLSSRNRAARGNSVAGVHVRRTCARIDLPPNFAIWKAPIRLCRSPSNAQLLHPTINIPWSTADAETGPTRPGLW